jgi:hypothetical protein
MPSPKSRNIEDKKDFHNLYLKCDDKLQALFDSLKQEATKISTDIDWGFTNTPDFRLSYKYVFCTMKPQVRKKVIELRFRVEDLNIDNIPLTCLEKFNSRKKRRVDIYVEEKEQISEVVNLIKDIYYDNYPKLREKKEQDELKRVKASNLPQTKKEVLIQSRLGQGKFRKDVMQIWKNRCAITGASILLIASHIKPWCESSDKEKLDAYNGLSLSVLYDKAFDEGLITFSKEGNIKISPILSENELEKLGINKDAKLSRLDEKHLIYLDYHRNHIFKKAN